MLLWLHVYIWEIALVSCITESHQLQLLFSVNVYVDAMVYTGFLYGVEIKSATELFLSMCSVSLSLIPFNVRVYRVISLK